MRHAFLAFDRFAQGRPFALRVAGALALVAVTGWLDYLTGFEVVFYLFYVAPVLYSAWYLGRAWGYLGGLLSAVTALLADAAGGRLATHPHVALLNAAFACGFYAVLVSLAEALKSTLARERRLARTDPLTGAANLRSLMEALAAEMDRSQRYGHSFALACLDMDDFKTVNDTMGHVAGDSLLQAVARAVRANIRKSDLLARVGGDEFVILMPETERASAEAALQKVRDMLRDEAGKLGVPVGFSAGLLSCGTSCDAEALLRRADELMYEAKKAGKNGARVDFSA